MIISIHQPSFFAYSGVLEKIAESDVHVVLANAQFERGNYHNRFRLGDGHELWPTYRWLTMSINQHLEPLIDKKYNRPREDWTTIKRKIPEYEDVLAHFDDCIRSGPYLVDVNFAILLKVLELLEVETRVIFDYPTTLRGTERLVDICRRTGASTYLSGPSGPKYLDMKQFKAAGIAVEIQAQVPPRAAVEVLRERAFSPVAKKGAARVG